jgi:mono/diheme cytochrome c family protein
MNNGTLPMIRRRFTASLLATVAVSAILTGCRKPEMHQQEKKDPHEASTLFADGIASRPLVEGTVVRGQPRTDGILYTGTGADGKASAEFPWQMTAADLQQGKKMFDIYCYVCHGKTGYGDGMIVQRGFVRPQSFHTDRVKNAPPGYIYQVITNGYGAMYSYAERVTPEDRWRIAAYIKALQVSQSQEFATLTPEEKTRVAQSTTQPAITPASKTETE